MPAFYAHKRFAEEVVLLLPSELQSIIKAHPKAFILGTQGPDILFNYRPFKRTPTRERALIIHESNAKAFFQRAHALSLSENLKLNAYLIGIICHFVLDNACHPDVYRLEDTGVEHGRIESEFDKYLKKRAGMRVHKNEARVLSFRQGASDVCATILQVEEKDIRRAVRTMRTVNGCFAFPSRLWQRFAGFVLRKIGGAKFFEMFLHFDDLPQMQALNPVLAQKFDEAKPKAAELVTAFFNPNSNVELFDAFDKDFRGEPIK